MSRIALWYSGQRVGWVFVDDELDPLEDYCKVLCMIPRKVYTIAEKRPDVVAALLKEDPFTRHKVRPFVIFLGKQIYLVHIALRPEILRIISAWKLGLGEFPTKEKMLWELGRICRGIGRVAYVNTNHTDCRTFNLREVVPDEEDYVV